MLFSLYIIAGAYLAALVAAQYPNSFSIPPSGYSFTAGQTAQLNWTILAGDTVTIKLRSGVSTVLDAGTTIVSGLKNTGSYSWSIPADMVKGDMYTLEIVDDDNTNIINYTPQFPIDSNVLTSASASASATVTTVSSDTTSTTGTSITTSTSFITRTNSTTSTRSTHNSTAAATTTTSSQATSTSTEETSSASASTGAAAHLIKPALGGSILAAFALVIDL